ncbi:hypothetical protein [Streptomyces hydrogenans]|uniref:hypothetical protein n=1 Tax=Streptomyces hydrogenans TaxID=1873719 RepID=UPI0034158795
MTQEASGVHGAVWLAQSSRGDHAYAVWHEWNRHRYAVLPTGIGWDVVAVPRTWLRAAAQHRSEAWTDVPLLDDISVGYTYVWMPLGTHADWAVPGTRALGSPWVIAVPQPSAPPAGVRKWAQPPGAYPRLMDPAALREALDATQAAGGRTGP